MMLTAKPSIWSAFPEEYYVESSAGSGWDERRIVLDEIIFHHRSSQGSLPTESSLIHAGIRRAKGLGSVLVPCSVPDPITVFPALRYASCCCRLRIQPSVPNLQGRVQSYRNVPFGNRDRREAQDMSLVKSKLAILFMLYLTTSDI
jgi:hypothetical protein